jgi:ubiquinone biosynthesis protein
MEFVEAQGRINNHTIKLTSRRLAVRRALQALYRMIFEVGCFHCDPHPGNLLITVDEVVAVLDFGLVAEFKANDRRAFAEFFYSITAQNGRTAARIVRETALCVPECLDPILLERDLTVLLASCAGKTAAQFQIARFVTELFRVQRAHGIYGSPQFTLAILTLLVFEGVIKEVDPDLDFQQEAIPSVIVALTR